MLEYFQALMSRGLALPLEVLPFVWLALYLANSALARAARHTSAAQRHVQYEQREVLLARAQRPGMRLLQLLLAAIAFTVALIARGAIGVAFAGGIVLQLATVFSLNVHAFLAARALARSGASSGELSLSPAYAYREMSARLHGGAVLMLLIGLLLPHLAPIGAAYLLFASALGYSRRAAAAPTIDAGAPVAGRD